MPGTESQRVTLRDVAVDAGVSTRTVSYVVRGSHRISEPTRQRVQASINRLRYRPNLAARQLRSGRTGMIGLGLPDLGVPYFAELLQVIVAEANLVGYTVIIEQTDGLAERERALIQRDTAAGLLDGVILSPLALNGTEIAKILDSTDLVLLGERDADGRFDHVAIDNVAAARAATQHLLDKGFERIAVLGVQPDSRTATLRQAGFLEAMAGANLSPDPTYLQPADRYYRQDGVVGMARLLDLAEPPEAVVCFSDLLALGAMRECLSRRLKVPGDVALIGFDDIEDGRFSTPTLSTIRPDKAEIGRWAVTNLLGRLSGDTSRPREHVARFDVVARESTLGRRRRARSR